MEMCFVRVFLLKFDFEKKATSSIISNYIKHFTEIYWKRFLPSYILRAFTCGLMAKQAVLFQIF